MAADKRSLEHLCGWGCTGETHIDVVGLPTSQTPEENLRKLREEYASRGWRIVDVSPTSRVRATIGGQPFEVIFRSATQP